MTRITLSHLDLWASPPRPPFSSPILMNSSSSPPSPLPPAAPIATAPPSNPASLALRALPPSLPLSLPPSLAPSLSLPPRMVAVKENLDAFSYIFRSRRDAPTATTRHCTVLIFYLKNKKSKNFSLSPRSFCGNHAALHCADFLFNTPLSFIYVILFVFNLFIF